MPSDPADPAPAVAPPPPEARQRWRLVVARSATAPAGTQRDVADAWEAAIGAAGLPVARTADARARARISFGAPLPAGIAAEAELIDVVLTERWPAWRLRAALVPHVPAGWHVMTVEDVWLAAPALAGRVAAADYRITLDGLDASDVPMIDAACRALLAATALPRERLKGDRPVSYDLRPLVIDVSVADVGPMLSVRCRTRIHPELGTGRPEEVVAVLAGLAGRPLRVTTIVRERLLLADEVD